MKHSPGTLISFGGKKPRYMILDWKAMKVSVNRYKVFDIKRQGIYWIQCDLIDRYEAWSQVEWDTQ